MGTSLEARVQFLETREDAFSRDLIRLKTENAELQSTVFELKRENLHVSEKFEEMDAKVCKMHDDLQAVFSLRESIEDRLTSLEKNTGCLKDMEDRLSGVETVMNQLRQEMKSYIPAVNKKLDNIQGEARKALACLGDCRDQVSVHERLQRLTKEIAELVLSHERNRDSYSFHKSAISNSVTSVKLKTGKELTTGVRTKLDKLIGVLLNGYFNEDSCCLDPPIAGKYLVNVGFCQVREGRMQIVLKTESGAHEWYYGMTSANSDVCSTMNVLDLNKGEKCWLEIKQIEGEAKLHWCLLTCWLISPEI